MQWQVLVPVKSLEKAKTRVDLTNEDRAELALAMCMDVVTAAVDAPDVLRVHVLSRDARVVAAVRDLGARVSTVPGADGLNEEISAAAQTVRKSHGVAAVMADLPCLTGDILTKVLRLAPPRRVSFMRDMEGRGTTMVFLPPSSARIATRFGPESAAAHLAIATPLPSDPTWFAAQRDVDTLLDLAAARDFGVGTFTAALPIRIAVGIGHE